MEEVTLPEAGTKVSFTASTSRSKEWLILRGSLGTSDDGEKIEVACIFPADHDEHSPKLAKAVQNFCQRTKRNLLATNAKLKKKYGSFVTLGKFRNLTVTLPDDSFEDEGVYDSDYRTWAVGPSDALEDAVGQMLVRKAIALAESSANDDDDEDDDE